MASGKLPGLTFAAAVACTLALLARHWALAFVGLKGDSVGFTLLGGHQLGGRSGLPGAVSPSVGGNRQRACRMLWRAACRASLAGATALAAAAAMRSARVRAKARRCAGCLSAISPKAARAVRKAAAEVMTPCSRLLHGFMGLGAGISVEPLAMTSGGSGSLLAADRARPARDIRPAAPMSGPRLRAVAPTSHPLVRRRPAPLDCIEEGNTLHSQTHASPPLPDSARSPPGTPGTPQATPVVAPSDDVLGGIFEQLDVHETGLLGLDELTAAVPLLNAHLRFDLEANDAKRLYSFMKGSSSDLVTRAEFIDGLRELGDTLQRLSAHMTARQMKTVLVAAFDRFDTNGDGEISIEEFLASIEMIGVKISIQDAVCLHRFLSGTSVIEQGNLVNEPPFWEKWASTWGRSVAQLRDKYGWTSMENLMDRVKGAFDEPGSIEEKVQRALKATWEGVDDVCDAAEFAVDAAGLTMAMRYVSDELTEELTTGTIQSLDFMSVAPFAVCLAIFASNMAKELDELVPKDMTPDEALLYTQCFKQHGFSQAEFRQVLSCPGCRWGRAAPGEILNEHGDASVKLIVKGRVEITMPGSPTNRRAASLGPGASIGGVGYLRGREIWVRERVTAKEPLVYVSWDPEGLRRCLGHNEDLSLRMDSLLADTFATHLRAILKLRRKTQRLARDRLTLTASLSAAAGAPAAAAVAAPQQPALLQAAGGVSVHQAFDTLLETMGLNQKRPLGHHDLMNFFSRLNRDLNLDVTRDVCEQLFSYLDKDGDGAISPSEFRMRMRELGRCLDMLDGISMQELATIFVKGKVDTEDLKGLMMYVDKNLVIGTAEEDSERLFKHCDKDGDGEVSLQEFISELNELEGCLHGLGGLSVHELTTLVHRAFQQFDANSDGVVSADEFVQAVQRLEIPLSHEQAITLHSYLDADKDGEIDLGEWRSGNAFPAWLEAVNVALEKQAKRVGLARLGYIAETVGEIVEGPGDLFTKGRLMLARMWDCTNELADAANCFTDSVGVCAALSGIWQEVSGINSLAEVDEVDLLPFMLCLGISAVHMVRHLAEGQVSDLSEQEALLYATVFQRKGFSVTEFKRLLGYGEARWVQLAEGETMQEVVGGEALCTVVRGSCELLDRGGQKVAYMGAGAFLGKALGRERADKGAASGTTAKAAQPTMLLTWNSGLLEKQLKSDESVRLKVTRAMTISMADYILSAKEHIGTPPARACAPVL